MDDGTKYAAFKVPRREEQGAEKGAGRITSVRPGEAAPFTDAGFAEIELGALPNRTAAGDATRHVFQPAAQTLPRQEPKLQPRIQPQPIAQRAFDPIRQRFFDMRSLASDRPFARGDSELFYRQAKFMEDFSDDYEGDAKMQMYFPYYQHMGYEQLRTYFTWRAKARQGELPPTSVSYAFLYVYELLSGIGVSSPEDGLGKLLGIWDTFIRYGPALLNYLPQWFKDYHIYYETKNSFSDFVKEHKMHRYYPEMFLLDADAENSFEVWNCISDYSAAGSKFYKAGNEQLMGDCLKYVIAGIRDMCGSIKIHYEDLFIYRYSRVGAWYPFKQALFYPGGNQPDRTVNMPGKERYQCKNGRWSANLPIYYSSQKHLVGTILKKMESCLRKAVKFKYQLKSEPCTFYRSSGTPIDFDGVIEKAVADYFRDLTRTVVTVDHANLARIRKEALGTQNKLIVPENDATPAAPVKGVPPATPVKGAPSAAPIKSATPAAVDKSVPTADPGSGLPLADTFAAAPPAAIDSYHEVQESEAAQAAAYDGWAELKAALGETERKALSIALRGGTDIKAFADKNGIMLEVLADNINEKAADYIGDSILEVDGGVVIYEEYRDNVAKIAEGANA